MLNHFDIVSIFLFIAMLLLASSVQAGTVEVTPNGTVWTSTQCVEPKAPPALSGDPETPADTVNAHIVAYNDFAQAQQSYMICLSREAQNDAAVANWIRFRGDDALLFIIPN